MQPRVRDVERTLGWVASNSSAQPGHASAVLGSSSCCEREFGQPTFVAIGETVSGWGSWKQSSMKLSLEYWLAPQLARLLGMQAAGLTDRYP